MAIRRCRTCARLKQVYCSTDANGKTYLPDANGKIVPLFLKAGMAERKTDAETNGGGADQKDGVCMLIVAMMLMITVLMCLL